CAYVIPKGGFDEVRRKGLEAVRQSLVEINPALADRVQELTSWGYIKLLTVAIERLKRWYRDGLLCIGDAAHAMSPVGGTGINVAIQDPVAAGNILGPALRKGPVPETLLAEVQKRREWPTRMTQRLQVVVQNLIIRNVLQMQEKPCAPFLVKLLNSLRR